MNRTSLALLAMFVLTLAACTQDDAPLTLNAAAQRCASVLDAHGNRVLFWDTPFASDDQWTARKVCDVPKDVLAHTRASAEDTIAAICIPTEKLVERYGNGNYAAAIQGIGAMPRDQNTAAALTMLEMCASKESRRKAMDKGTPLKAIYSVGTIHWDGKKCPAYLVETNTRYTPNQKPTHAFDLYGMGKCAGLNPALYAALTHHPQRNPSGVPTGDYLMREYSYTGAMPETYIYHDQTYPYRSQ